MIDTAESGVPTRTEVKRVAPVPFARDVVCVDDHAIVSVEGELDLAAAPVLLHELVSTLLLPISRITLDLERMTFLDSSGLETLVRIRRYAADVDIACTLESVPGQARRVIELTGLDGLLGLTC